MALLNQPSHPKTLTLVLLAAILQGCGLGANPPAASLPPPSISTDRSVMVERWQDGRTLFDYDAEEPLNLVLADLPFASNERASLFEISYDSPRGGRVPASLILPASEGPFAAVIVMHGLPGNRHDLDRQFLDAAGHDVAAIFIDAPFNRPGHERSGSSSDIVTFTPQDRDEQIQLIVDLRRAVDVLASFPIVDERRIGYLGISYGAAMGGLLAGVEDRIAAYVLAVGDGGLVEHFLGPDDASGRLLSLQAPQRDAWIAAMEPIEPLYFVGQTHAPLFFQAAEHDEFIPRPDSERYHSAAPDGSVVQWYDSGHDLPISAWCDARAWLGGAIDVDAGAFRGCATATGLAPRGTVPSRSVALAQAVDR
jgi:dienelactone hydrolase